MRIAYFEPASGGISGDMAVAALLDAGTGSGLTTGGLEAALSLLGLKGFSLEAAKVKRCGLEALSFRVTVDEGGQSERDWAAIRRLLEDAAGRGLGARTVGRALAVFEALAHAEATVHGVEPEKIHFHEVGAVDSVVDIVAACWCLDELGVEACFTGPIPLGSGSTGSRHGRLPVPAPATVELLKGFEVVAGEGKGELVTPTGAALLAALARPLRPSFVLTSSGSGAGSADFDDRANLLRVLIGEADAESDEEVVVIEADIDDMTAEALAFTAERLRGAGARDVSLMPLQMKKGRPGTRLTVLCGLGSMEDLTRLALAESSTLGLRFRCMARVVLDRRIEMVETAYGTVALKVARRPGGKETAEPEFEDVARAAIKHGVGLEKVRRAAFKAWRGGGVR